jgi:uncharacterized protein (TIGR02453 family)
MAELLTCPGPTKEFPGFCPQGIALLRNHRRGWSQSQQELYEYKITTPLLNLVCSVSREFARFAPNYSTLPGKAVFRIFGEAASSRNKVAHRTHPAAIWVHRDAKSARGACFYFHFTAKEAVVLGGVYSAEPDELLAYRRLLHDHYMEFEAILRDPKLRSQVGELQGDKASRMPKGLCPNHHHPAADLMKQKQWYLVSMLDLGLLSTDRLLPTLVHHFEVMTPMVEFLNRPFAQKPRVKRMAFSVAPGSCD